MSKYNYTIFTYLSLNVKVSCYRKDHIAWLTEFLYPQFEITDSNLSDCEIAFIENDCIFNKLHRIPPRLRKEVNGFTLDTKIIKLLLWYAAKRWQVLFDEELNVFYQISYRRNQVCILCPSNSSFAARMALLRVIREYAMNYDYPEAGYFVHSSALDYQGTAVMIAGPKNSAKTSLLIYFLLHLSSQFISNDRVFLYFDNFTPIVKGMPTVVTIPQTTQSMFSRVGVSLPIYKYHHWYTLAESIDQQYFLKGSKEGDYTITPRQFCELIGTESCCKTNLSAIIFPRVSKTRSGILLEKIAKGKATERLKEVRFAKDIIHKKSVFHLASEKSNSNEPKCSYDEFISKCASEILCFDCIVGYNAYEKNTAEELIEEVLGKKK
jgi:hypothetical protein